MINLNNVATPPADLPATMQTLSDLVSLLADPVAAKQRVADLQAATAAFRDAIEKSKTERATFDVAQVTHRKRLDAQPPNRPRGWRRLRLHSTLNAHAASLSLISAR